MGNAESAQISKSDSLRPIFQRYLEELKTSVSQSGNLSTGKDCPGFPGLKCDPLTSHCPYSTFGEPECPPCDSTCNPDKLVSADRIVDCLQQCPAYLLNELGLLNKNSENSNGTVAVAVLSVIIALLFVAVICFGIWWKRRSDRPAGRHPVQQGEGNQVQEQGLQCNGLPETAKRVEANGQAVH